MALRKRQNDNSVSVNPFGSVSTDYFDDRNTYISDGNKAVSLIAELIPSQNQDKLTSIAEIRNTTENIFRLLSRINFDGELEYYREMLLLCDRLSEQQKLSYKTIVGFGGCFSAGKSAFINAISGLDNILPEAQNPTTSIPTYIIAAADNDDKETRYTANTSYGDTIELDAEKMQAMTHEFHEEYKIGFSAFVDSVTIETKKFRLPRNIALLDTPGYSKPEEKSDSKAVMTDREKATEQLKITDFLIWLVDIDNGDITNEDIVFINNLKIQSPILIVLNKADKKTEEQIQSVVERCTDTVKNRSLNCFGVAAYSSFERKEYTDGVIDEYLNMLNESDEHISDIKNQFNDVLDRMIDDLVSYMNSVNDNIKEFWGLIGQINSPTDISSVAKLWSNSQMQSFELTQDIAKVRELSEQLRNMLDKLWLGGEEREAVLQ